MTASETLALSLLAFGLTVVGCTSPSARDSTSAPPGSVPPRTLVMAINAEVASLSPMAIGGLPSPGRTTRIFNADLAVTDAQENVRPYLAESLPALNTDNWQVFPDGRMQTTWKLRPDLTWQDGQPLTAEDFVFALQVYRAPGLLGAFEPKPQDVIERVVAVDPRTLRIEWDSSFLHQGEGLTPLPRHILSEPFTTFARNPNGQPDAFLALRFWTTEYVGAGPYRLTNWEPASYLEGEAFDGHVLGRPKIDRVVIRIIGNPDTVLAHIMAGEVDATMSLALRVEQAMILREQGGFNDVEKRGALLFVVPSLYTAFFQQRTEYQQTPALHDPRVRKAVVHAIDRDGISERLYAGLAGAPISFLKPRVPYSAEVDRATPKYPYDPRRTELLMNEAGYSRDRDGFFADATGGRFRPAYWQGTVDNQHNVAAAIVLSTLQGAGIDAQHLAVPPAQQRDREFGSTFPGIYTNAVPLGVGIGGAGIGIAFNLFGSEAIPTPANRWTGSNRGGWSNPAFDLLLESYNSTLDGAEKVRAFARAMTLLGEQVPAVPLYFNLQVISHNAALKGPEGDLLAWNIHNWEWDVRS